MLRLETQKDGEFDITLGRIEFNTVPYPLYTNVIKEPVAHFPTGHYVSLVSAYTPLSYNDVGQFTITIGIYEIFKYDNSFPIKSFNDIVDKFAAGRIKLEVVSDGRIKFTVHRAPPEDYPTSQYKIECSPTAAWFFGFKKQRTAFTHRETGPLRFSVYSDFKYPPATVRYLQVICKNACGTTDSNITMPTTMGIMHVTDKLTLINPHIAVNHRIEKGRIIDIEILDQNNQPFRWAPVYLELFVSESAEHEKKQGFFRFEKSHAVHLHAPVKMISVPNVFAAESMRPINFHPEGEVYLKIGVHEKVIKPTEIKFIKSLEGTTLTRNAVIAIFKTLEARFKILFKNIIGRIPEDYTFFEPTIEQDNLIIVVNIGLFKMNDFMQIFDTYGNPLQEYVGELHRPLTIHIDPSYWYTDDVRLLIYCKEYHDHIPVAVARRISNYYQIVNRAFWTWHEFEKPANELHFRADRVIRYPDGSVSCEPWPSTSELLLQLFYK